MNNDNSEESDVIILFFHFMLKGKIFIDIVEWLDRIDQNKKRVEDRTILWNFVQIEWKIKKKYIDF